MCASGRFQRVIKKLFNGILGKFNGPKVHLEVDPKVPPKKTRYYEIPHRQKPTFKTELDRLVKLGILEEAGRADWISGTFIIPKKDTTVCWISDFWALNKALKMKTYPMLKIQDILK